MPQNVDIEGVGVVEFPDDAKPEEIQQFLDDNYNKGGKTSAGGAFVRSAAESVLPGAAFMAGAIPGAEAGAMIGSAIGPVGTVIGGAIGGMVTGIPAQIVASKLQRKAAEAIAPQTAKEFYSELEAGQQEHPWASAAGGVAALGASARTAPFKIAQLPFRVGLGAGMAVGVPAVTEGRLPTAPEFVSGVAMGTLFAEHRFSKAAGPRPASPPEVRSDIENKLVQRAKEKRGLDLVISDEPLERPEDVINIIPETKNAKVNRANLHEYIEQDLPKDISADRAINDLIEHEFKHTVTAPKVAEEFWDNLSPYEQYLEKRRFHGAFYEGKPWTNQRYGAESIRFWTNLAENQSTTEFIQSAKRENRTVKFLTAVQRVAQWTRKNLGSDLSKEQLQRNREIIDDVIAKSEAAKQAIKEGAPDALQPEAAQPVRDVRTPTEQVIPQVPAQEGGPAAGVGGGQGQVAQEVQIPLKPQAGRGMATIKNPPVVKDVPAGSIHPDSIVPAIRLINGDVVHGWIKRNGKAATHPEIAKRYDITIDELDRKGWISKDGKAFYEREPAAVGTGLPTQKKEGELHSTDKPAEEAPPAAPTEGAQPTQAATGLATRPPEALTSGGPAATATISTAFPESKMRRLDELNKKVTAEGAKFTKAEYDEWARLSGELEEAEAAAGLQPGPQAAETVAMSRKQAFTRESEAEDYLNRMRMENPRADFQMEKVGDEWQVGPTKAIPTAGADPNRVAEDLGLKYAGSIMGRDQYLWIQRDEQGMSRVTVTVPQGSSAEVVRAKLQQRLNEPLAMSRKSDEREFELLREHWLKTIKPWRRELLDAEVARGQGTENIEINFADSPGARDVERARRYYELAQSLYGRGAGALAMSRKGRYTDETGAERELEPPKGEWMVTVQRPDGSTYEAAYGGKKWVGYPGDPYSIAVIKEGKWSHGMTRPGEKIIEGETAPVAMSRKGLDPEKRAVVERIASTVGGIGKDPEKHAIVLDAAKQILSAPKEHWPAMLDDFQAKWKAKEMADAYNKMQSGAVLTAEEGAVIQKAIQQGFEMAEKLSPENIAAVFGAADRQVAYRSALAVLSREPTPISAEPVKTKVKVLPAAGEPVSMAVSPKYNVGDYNEFWGDFSERYPHIPEQVAMDVWNEALNDFLNNASGETITKLLRPARLEKRFLGNLPVETKGGKVVADPRRTIIDPDPDPILAEISKAPDPKQSVAFRKFMAARDMTPEQGLAELKRLQEKVNEEMRALAITMEPEPSIATAADVEAMRKAGRKLVMKPAAKEPLSQSELNRLSKERTKGRELMKKRRESAINALSEWYMKQAKMPGMNPMRRTISLDEVVSFNSFTKQEGEDAATMREELGGGSTGKKTATLTKALTVVVDRNTGDYHAVSTYIRDGIPRIYDPSHYAGSKAGDYIDINQLLARYRVVGSLELEHPVIKFHQQWLTTKESTGEAKFNGEIGDVATLKSAASNAAYMRYVRLKRRAEREEIRRKREERFKTGVTEEEEVTGEAKTAPETVAETEAEAARKKEETTAREEEPELGIREQMVKAREEAGLKPWEEGEDWDPEQITGRMSKLTRDAIDAWRSAVATGKELIYLSGRQAIKLFETDLRSVAHLPLAGPEAESLYLLAKEHKVGHPLDLQKMLDTIYQRRRKTGLISGREISAQYAIDKIASKIQKSMLESPYEKAKTAHLPPIPEDTEYIDMTPAEKEHYIAKEGLKYRALLRTFDRIYELIKESTTAGERSKAASAKGVSLPEDIVAFRTKAMDRWGDTARRDLEQAAVQAQRAAEASGERSLIEGLAPRQPRPAPGPVAPFSYPQKFPRAAGPPEMLPPGTIRPEPFLPPKGAFPTVPTTPSKIGGKRFTGLPPAKTPEIATPVPFGAQEKGFVPRAPSRQELLTMPMEDVLRLQKQHPEWFPGEPLAMTRKGVGAAKRYQEELLAQGRTTFKKEDVPLLPKAQLISAGRNLVLSGKINPEKEMRQVERGLAKGGTSFYMSVDSTLAFRYWDYRLQGVADAEANKYGTKSKQYQDLEAISAEWKRRMDRTSKKLFARTGHALQGWNQIGPDDMRSTTFVRNMLKKVKAKQRGVDEDEVVLSDEDEATVDNITQAVSKGEISREDLEMAVGQEAAKGLDPELGTGEQQLVKGFDQYRKQARNRASEMLKKGAPKSASMAMKGQEGELPKLDRLTEDILGNVGMDVMADLSKSNDLTDARWIEEMKKALASPEISRPDLEPYLPHIRAVSEEIRDTALNNFIGTGDPVKDARNIFTRKRPPIEESIAAIRRALEADPTGNRITPAESFHVWSYLKSRFFDRGVLDFRTIREQASAELGIKDELLGVTSQPYSQLRLFRAMSANRTMRKMTDELVKRIRDEARIKGQAMNWLRNQQYPGWLRTIRFFPRLFFFDKILGHGFVPMITHAPSMMFNPQAWSVYFGTWRNGKWNPGAWQMMYRMAIGEQPFRRFIGQRLGMEWTGKTGEQYWEEAMQNLTGHERFEFWKSAGLQADPFKYTDDYQIEALQNIFGPKLKGLIGGRGFDALKTLRYAMAEKWLNSLPEHLRNKDSAKLIADSVNHATGIVKTPFHESLNWLMFAPKLEASRWAYLFKDTIKAMDYIRNWRTASMEQRAWAKAELKQKALVVGWYYGMLALNQAFLKMCNSDQDVNFTDPKKPDFMQFKVAGFRVGVTSPFIGVVRLFSNALHAAAGERTKFERLTSRQKQVGETAWQYGRGKMSPLASFATDIATQEDFAGRQLPWSDEAPSLRRRLAGLEAYGTGEYIAQTIAPIPIEEAIRDTFKSMGMTEPEITKFLRTLVIAGGMGATGARVAHDVE